MTVIINETPTCISQILYVDLFILSHCILPYNHPMRVCITIFILHMNKLTFTAVNTLPKIVQTGSSATEICIKVYFVA